MLKYHISPSGTPNLIEPKIYMNDYRLIIKLMVQAQVVYAYFFSSPGQKPDEILLSLGVCCRLSVRLFLIRHRLSHLILDL